MLSARIDVGIYEDVQQLWHDSDLKRWEVVEEVVRLGVQAYKARPQTPGLLVRSAGPDEKEVRLAESA